MEQDLFIEIQGRVALLVHHGGAYTPKEWRAVVELTRRADVAELRFLVYDMRGTISAAQRADLINCLDVRMPTAAVLTGSVLTRGVVTAIGWFKPGIKAFEPDELEQAARYLGLTEEERALAGRTAELAGCEHRLYTRARCRIMPWSAREPRKAGHGEGSRGARPGAARQSGGGGTVDGGAAPALGSPELRGGRGGRRTPDPAR
jgi:hypothetical protein